MENQPQLSDNVVLDKGVQTLQVAAQGGIAQPAIWWINEQLDAQKLDGMWSSLYDRLGSSVGYASYLVNHTAAQVTVDAELNDGTGHAYRLVCIPMRGIPSDFNATMLGTSDGVEITHCLRASGLILDDTDAVVLPYAVDGEAVAKATPGIVRDMVWDCVSMFNGGPAPGRRPASGHERPFLAMVGIRRQLPLLSEDPVFQQETDPAAFATAITGFNDNLTQALQSLGLQFTVLGAGGWADCAWSLGWHELDSALRRVGAVAVATGGGRPLEGAVMHLHVKEGAVSVAFKRGTDTFGPIALPNLYKNGDETILSTFAHDVTGNAPVLHSGEEDLTTVLAA